MDDILFQADPQDFKVHNGISYNLTRTVIGNVTPTVGFEIGGSRSLLRNPYGSKGWLHPHFYPGCKHGDVHRKAGIVRAAPSLPDLRL